MQKPILLFIAAGREFTAKNCPTMAAAIAYWAVLSLFPLALGGLSILGYVVETPEERRQLVLAVLEIVPVSADFLAETLEGIAKGRGTLTIVAAVGSLWSGLAVFGALRRGLNRVWEATRARSYLKGRAVDFVMFVALATGSLLMLAYATFGAAATEIAPGALRDLYLFNQGARIAVEVGTLAITFGAMVLLYRYVPNARVRFSDLWFGSLLAAVMVQGLRLGFAWFAENVARYNAVYGTVGSLIAVMVWAYLSSMAVLLGAQLSETYRQLYGSRASAAEAEELKRQYGWLLSPRSLMETGAQKGREIVRRTPLLRNLVKPVGPKERRTSSGSEHQKQ